MDYNRLKLIFITFCVIVIGKNCENNAERIRYDNYRVYTVNATNKNQLQLLKDLDGSSDSLRFLDGVHNLGKNINIIVAPHKIPDFLQILDNNGIIYKMIEKNVQEKLEISDIITPRSNIYDWKSYHELDDTYEWMKRLQLLYPNIIKLIKAGKTYEGRQILGVKLSYKNGNPGIFIEGGIHAREWISPATVTYILNQLLTSENNEIRQIAENYDWYFIPHANPDGYVYTHKIDRMWRKTRSPNGFCYGADPNRNWGFHWKEVGASNQPCSDTYAGSRAFSEIETKSLSKYILSLKGRLHLYLSFHSYSQLFLYPYGHTGDLPSNHKDLKKLFHVVQTSIKKRYGTEYTGGNVYDAIYPAAGASIDWVYGVVKTNLSFCYELRPSNKNLWNGFILPPEQIIPTGEETLDSVVALVNESKNLGYF